MSLLTKSKSSNEYTFPHPPWEGRYLKLIDRAIKSAWTIVLTKHRKNILMFSEDEITEKLEKEIQRLIDNESIIGFKRSIFAPIARGAEFISYNGVHLKKQPDLILRQIAIHPGINDSRQDTLFIECKVIAGGKNPKPPLLYIENGIRRFVDGEYAWAMSHALMIGYIKNDAVLPDSLKVSFNRNKGKKTVKRCFPLKGTYTAISSSDMPTTFQTTHSRTWQHGMFGSPDDIKLDHIWLSCI